MKRFSRILEPALVTVAIGVVAGCGTDLLCGEGTKVKDGFCVVDTGTTADTEAEADAEARDGERADPPPATVRGGAGTVNEGGRGPVPPAATAG